MISGHTKSRCPPASGITLMEVLIACGILIFGLSSIAALLPAAGARLGQANLEDRAGTLAANAYTDVVTRSLAAADIFSDHHKAVAFGMGMADLPNPNFASEQFTAPQEALITQRINPERGFMLEDEMLYAPSTISVTPVNPYLQGRRSFKEALCWGATLVPDAFPADAGTRARLSIAVFRKPPELSLIQLAAVNGVCLMNPGNEPIMKKFLRSCSYVLVMPTAANTGPRWFRVTASWIAPIDPITKQRLDDNCYVVFDDAGGESIAEFAGTEPTVIGFDGIVRLDEYKMILE